MNGFSKVSVLVLEQLEIEKLTREPQYSLFILF